MQRALLDKTIVILCCTLCAVFAGSSFTELLISFLCAISISCVSLYFYGKKVAGLFTLLLAVASCFYPVLLFFVPIVVYELCRSSLYLMLPFCLGFIVLHYLFHESTSVLVNLLLLCFLVLAGLLACYTKQAASLKETLRETTDTHREYELLMAERQRNYIEQQDNEIHMATLRERNRIAREIHDNVGHLLSRSILMLGAISAVNKDASFSDSLQELRLTLTGAMDSIRSSVHDLHDESVDLKKSVDEVVSNFKFCSISLDYSMSDIVERDTKYAFLGILKEALSNTTRHSDATTIFIIMQEHQNLYQLLIADNGTKQFTPSSDSSGLGLTNMEDRVRHLHGTFHVSTENGFRIFVTIPKNRGIENER